MSLILPSASQLTRVFACPDSMLITPSVNHAPSLYSARGDTIHAYVRNLSAGMSRADALALIAENDPNRLACEELDTTCIPRGGFLEFAIAYDPEAKTARALGEDLDRDYSQADRAREFVGSFDFIATTPAGGVVIDHKSGWLTIRARDSWQLRMGAVAGAALFGWGEVIVAHLDLRDPARARWDRHVMDGLELAAHRESLQELAVRLRARHGSAPEAVNEGAWCTYCPAWKACPAKVGLLQRVTQPEGLTVLPETVGAMSEALERYDAVAKRLRAEIDAYVREHGAVPRPDGTVLRLMPGKETDEIQDPVAAIELARQAFGEHAALAVRTSKAALNEAARAWAKEAEQPIGKTQDAMVARMRERGLIAKRTGEPSVKAVLAKELGE